jgi:hypothetical protein
VNHAGGFVATRASTSRRCGNRRCGKQRERGKEKQH